ncbi:cellulase family glycosylhydrolase [Actinomadura harenae]|uniref:Glycoside hydrolase family 5 domain-containing protein n=1 Tax=Actinomadura harenae TaxID=2483351 RepID=A0A3M2M398_9ACTN|nr:cellulase family glycosylhydrolase [Actinomadura harenae]RMI44224.1 hypothetical protein EBO15_13830 [Actinomadura harenae]
MASRRLPFLTAGVLAVAVVATALLDPVGFFALYGLPGDLTPRTRWQLAPLAVHLPLVLAGTAWVTHVFGRLPRRRFATVWAGTVLAVLVAKAVTVAVATVPMFGFGDIVWSTSYTVPKAALYALLPAAVAWWFGRSSRPAEEAEAEAAPVSAWAVAGTATLAAAVSGPWVSSHWSRDLPGWVPSASPDAEPWAFAAGLAVLFLLLARTQRTFARRSGGLPATFLGGWIATLWAGAGLGVAQVVALVISDGFGSPLQTPAALYVRIAEGVSLGLAVGWTAGLAALLLTVPAGRLVRPAHRIGRAVPGVLAVVVLAGVVVAAGGSDSGASTVPSGRVGDGLSPLRAVRGDHPRIVDAAGRQVLLRGVNVNQLVDFYAGRPGFPATRPLGEDDFRQMAGLGFDVVRLGVSWSAIEPSPGRYDQSYLGRVDQAIAWARANDMYTVLDMHQDGWSNAPTPRGASCPAGTSRMDGYDGAPTWATHADGAPRCQFTGRDISPAGDRAFTNFYYDRDGVQTRLVDTWGMLAARYGTDPSVAGFDPLNEPGFGEQAPVTSTLLLGRFYDRVLERIRSAEARPHLFFAEPSIFWSGTGFDPMPRGSFTGDPDVVFAPHLYAESITMDASLGLPAITSVEHGFTLASRIARNIPVWSGEWGYWGSEQSIHDKIRRYAAQEDRHGIGGAFWVWKQACGDPQNGAEPIGNALNKVDCATGKDLPRDSVTVETLSRAYPRAVPGRLTKLTHTRAGGIHLEGTASGGDCALDIWLPDSAARPVLVTRGKNVEFTGRRVAGAWRVGGCATGRYSLDID